MIKLKNILCELKYDSFEKKLIKKYDLKDLTLGGKENIIKIHSIIVKEKGSGIGTKVMEDICNYADENKLTIILTPDKSFGATSVGRLNKFYKRFGFVENKGRNADYSLSASMYRRPKK